jgi:ParB family chromosome partitioning protein
LLQLPVEVQGWVRDGQLSAGHARALITTDDPVRLAKEVISRGLSVRETERLAKRPSGRDAPKKAARPSTKDADTKALEQDLSAALGMKVAIDHKGLSGGQVTIGYGDLDELDQICQLLGSGR